MRDCHWKQKENEKSTVKVINDRGNPNTTCHPVQAQLVTIQAEADVSLEQIYENLSTLAHCPVWQIVILNTLPHS